MGLNKSIFCVGREMLALAGKHGIPQREIAEEFGVSLGTLRRREIWTKKEIKELFEIIYRKTGTTYDLAQTIRNIELKPMDYEITADKMQGRPYLELDRVSRKGRASISPLINGFGITLKEVENAEDGVPRLSSKLARVAGLDEIDLIKLSNYLESRTGIHIHPLDFESRYLPLDKVTY